MLPYQSKPNETLDYLFAKVPTLNNDTHRDIANRTMNYYKGSKKERTLTSLFQDLENKWYSSLEEGNPAYFYYSYPEMVIETWCCFHLYSKNYISLLSKFMDDSSKADVKTIVDLGCGVGFTTSYLKHVFPNAKVYGTNVRGTQWDVASDLGKEQGFTIVESINDVSNIDLVFASEYFEHFERPIEHLKSIIDKEPKMLLIANSFGSKSFGHFNVYKNENQSIENKKVGRLFNSLLRERYKPLETGFWNNRPSLWVEKWKQLSLSLF